MKRKKNLIIKINSLVFIITFFTFFFLGIGYSILNQNLKITGNTSILANSNSNDVKFSINNSYSNGLYYYTLTMTVTNNTKTTINSWNVTMDIPPDASLITFSKISPTIQDTILICNNISSNSTIKPKKSTSFKFNFSTTSPKYQPTNIIFNSSTKKNNSI